MKSLIMKLFLKFRRFITFGIVGIINTLIDFTFFTISHKALNYTPAVSQVCGYLAGFICGFILNKNVTFKDQSGRAPKQLLRFAIVNAVSLGLSTFLIAQLAKLINPFIAKILVTGVVMLINYAGYNLFVFRTDEKGSSEEV